MASGNLLIAISNIGISLIIIGLSIPLVFGKIPMNSIYGIRFRKSYESDENWYKINKYGGIQLIIWSIPIFVIGVFCLLTPVPITGLINTILASSPLIILIPALISYKYSTKF